MKSVFTNAVIPHDGKFIYMEGVTFSFDNSGIIKSITSDRISGSRDLSEYICLPGFCDFHSHFPQYNLIGIDRGRLPEWLEKLVYPTEFLYNEFDYAYIMKWIGDDYRSWAWLIFIPIVIFIITAVSNGANLTDGIDGLATGVSAIVGSTLALLAWVSGNIIFANYLNIMFIPNIGELTIFNSAFVGATTGFLWYNTYPAQIFMGDTGSLALGGIIAVIALLIRKELLIPIFCAVFFAESISVIIQVTYFKFTKKY